MALRKAKISSGLVCGLPSGVPTVTVFKGIPFAKPPVGKLRWKAPQPCEPWEGEYKAYSFGPVPPSNRDKDSFTIREFAGYGLEDPMEETGWSRRAMRSSQPENIIRFLSSWAVAAKKQDFSRPSRQR